MFEVFGVLFISIPSVVMHIYFGDMCEAGRVLACMGLFLCYITGIFLIKKDW